MTQRCIQYNGAYYDKIRVLGKGSFGTAIVYRRRVDCTLVVLKEIDLTRFHNEDERLIAIQEARIMSKLNHNNVIKYYNAYTNDTKLIIEMEYASVGTLANYLSFQCQPLEEQEILVIFRQIASGLSYLHSRDIVHLDLKMANIFVTIEGLVKIGDFGIARFMNSAQSSMSLPHDSPSVNQTRTRTRSVAGTSKNPARKATLDTNNNSHHLGTLAYSSPERFYGDKLDFKSDIWSLGCILYELITSEPLFDSTSLPELVSNITKIQYQPIKRTITPTLREIFERMIAREPLDRPTADELVCLADQLISRLQFLKQRSPLSKHRPQANNHNRFDLSSECAFMSLNNKRDGVDLVSSINYPHSLVYQVRLDTRNVQVDRVNLPQTKRIKEMTKGKSHYLVLTYDNIVYGWGSKHCGQLGACNLTSSMQSAGQGLASSHQGLKSIYRASKSARSSLNSKDLQQQFNLALKSTPSSLASSTQTIIANPSATSSAADGGGGGGGASQHLGVNLKPITNQHLSRELVARMLEKSQPASRPFIINELNNRKIIQVAAGDDFSVFLSRTGIVMTCGDGSTGCLGRGDLTSCFTPCMVDALLNNDVVNIACGPKHVVAVCGNGRAFAWGKYTRGRLGIALDSEHFPANNNKKQDNANIDDNLRHIDPRGSKYLTRSQQQARKIIGKYVVIPQLVEFPQDDVYIKSAHCGDRGTIFIDSLDRCWACGENRFNKLGLDIDRKFKKTIIVEQCWSPTEILSLSKYRIISCSIGKNHSSFLTSESKLILLGHDIDHSHRLKSNVISNRESHRRISSQLHTNRKRSHQCQDNSLSSLGDQQIRGPNHKQLLRSMLANNQLLGYKLDPHSLNDGENGPALAKVKATRFQRQQYDSYLKKSRALKKMPFESVVSVSCTSKFSLALTNDNRVYFWGTRSYVKDIPCLGEMLAGQCLTASLNKSVEPQLVATSSDECLIKIGSTNCSLMSSIQTLGSDQPILHAQDPKLTADSLADLWILDFRPSPPSDSSSLSSSSSIPSTCCDDCCSLMSSDCESCDIESKCGLKQQEIDCNLDCLKHDAILEPQPIVSLYVPSMFNHNGGALHLVRMFCFDEDRFYLILDTTIRLQSCNRPFSGSTSRISNHQQINQSKTLSKTLNTVSESKSIKAPKDDADGGVMPKIISVDESAEASQQVKSHAKVLKQFRFSDVNDEQPSEMANKTQHINTNCQQATVDSQVKIEIDKEDSRSSESRETNEGSFNVTTVNVVSSHYGISLEEPRSLSTFAVPMSGHMIVGPVMNSTVSQGQPLQSISFKERSQIDNFDLADSSTIVSGQTLAGVNILRGRNRLLIKSESTTGDDNDETGSMPSWVKNEYVQNHHSTNDYHLHEQVFTLDSSESDESCVSELTDITLANPINQLEQSNHGKMMANGHHLPVANDQAADLYLRLDEISGSSESQTKLGQRYRPNSDTTTGDSVSRGSSSLARAISYSQPDISHISRSSSDDKNQQGSRRASMVPDNGVLPNNTMGLLDCHVYRSRQLIEESYSHQSSLINSIVSSRSGSIHPLIERMNIRRPIVDDEQSYKENIDDVEDAVDRMLTTNNNNNIMQEASKSCSSGQINIVSNELINNQNSHFVVSMSTSCEQVSKPSHQLIGYDPSITNKSSWLQGEKGYPKGTNKTASCSSINSLRKSFAKLFC